MDFLFYLNERVNPFQSIITLFIAILILSFFIASTKKAIKKYLVTLVTASLIFAFYLNIYSYISMGIFSSSLFSFGNIQMVEISIIMFCALNLLFFIFIYQIDSSNFNKILILFLFSVICAVFVIISKNFLLIFTSFSIFILTEFQLVSAINSGVSKIGLNIFEYFLRPMLTIILFFFAFSTLYGATDFKDFKQILQSEYISNPLVILSLIIFGTAIYLYFFLFPFQGPYMKVIKRNNPASNAVIWFFYFPVGIYVFLKLSRLYNFFIERNNIYLSIFLIIITCFCILAGNIGAVRTGSIRRIISFLFLFFISVFLLNISMYSIGIMDELSMDLFNFVNVLQILFSFMPLYVIFSSIEKNTDKDVLNTIKGLGRSDAYIGINLIILFLPWFGFIYHIKPFIKYFNGTDFLKMGVVNIILLVVVVSGFIFLLVNIFRIVANVFKKSPIRKVEKILFPKFLYVYITFFSFIILVVAIWGLLKILNVDIGFINFKIAEFNF